MTPWRWLRKAGNPLVYDLHLLLACCLRMKASSVPILQARWG
jgi:hypothetical protein